LVVAGGVEGELAEEFAVGGEDSDFEVVDEYEDALAGVSSTEADVIFSSASPSWVVTP
jgi:hypothetical protein